MNSINFLPIVVSAVVAFGLSSFWYSPILFGKEWLELQRLSLFEIKPKNVTRLYIIQFILTLITFTVLGFIISTLGIDNGTDGAFIGLLAWIGFIVPSFISTFLWKKESFTLVLIDTINYLIILSVGGAIIGAWN